MKIRSIILFIIVLSLSLACRKEANPPGHDNPESQGDTAYFMALEKETWQEVNEYRESIGLARLKAAAVITRQCRNHSSEIGEGKAKPHEGFNTRVDSIKTGMNVAAAGENIYEAEGIKESEMPERALEGWLKSPTHKAVVEGSYTHAGAGLYKTEKGEYFLTMIFVRE